MQIEIPNLTAKECGWIAITAAEGGVNYWARAAGPLGYDYTRWSPDDTMEPIDVPDDFVFYRLRYENPDDDGMLETDITPELMRRGIALILSTDMIRPDLRNQMIDLEDRAAMDADAADCLVQAGIFGKVVFG